MARPGRQAGRQPNDTTADAPVKWPTMQCLRWMNAHCLLSFNPLPEQQTCMTSGLGASHLWGVTDLPHSRLSVWGSMSVSGQRLTPGSPAAAQNTQQEASATVKAASSGAHTARKQYKLCGGSWKHMQVINTQGICHRQPLAKRTSHKAMKTSVTDRVGIERVGNTRVHHTTGSGPGTCKAPQTGPPHSPQLRPTQELQRPQRAGVHSILLRR
jgi:hypothetical protein